MITQNINIMSLYFIKKVIESAPKEDVSKIILAADQGFYTDDCFRPVEDFFKLCKKHKLFRDAALLACEVYNANIIANDSTKDILDRKKIIATWRLKYTQFMFHHIPSEHEQYKLVEKSFPLFHMCCVKLPDDYVEKLRLCDYGFSEIDTAYDLIVDYLTYNIVIS